MEIIAYKTKGYRTYSGRLEVPKGEMNGRL